MSDADRLRAELERVARSLGAPESTSIVIERPRDPSFGDWATNLAMTLAKPLSRKPREIAQQIVDTMDLVAAGASAAEIAGPGFINFRLDTGALAGGLVKILASDTEYGRSPAHRGEQVNVEFVSANPTGPLHVGHGRQAALGDAISTLLEWNGWSVDREFYYNDGGAQIENLSMSVWARIAEKLGEAAVLPSGGYHGEYIREIAERFLSANASRAGFEDAIRTGAKEIARAEAQRAAETVARAGSDDEDDAAAGPPSAVKQPELDPALFNEIRMFAVAELRKEQDLDLKAFGVSFDTYFLESSLYTDKSVEKTVELLKKGGHTYEKDGALWLRTTDFGDDKDRVMRKNPTKGGGYTYFLPDVAYHVTKWDRGFKRAINVQGSDHHSTVNRVRIGLQALEMGIPTGYPDYVLHSMVTVMRGGEEVKISKRAGSYVTVRELVDEVGRDAVRWFFLMRKGESQLSFDVDLARKQSDENPVYYVQMAHARMSGIFRVGGIDASLVTGNAVDLAVLDQPEEKQLVKALLDFPAMVKGAAEAMEPHRITNFLHDTAGLAHSWYHKHHVLGEPDAITNARLVLARAAQIVIRNGLAIVGVSAPERM